MRQQIPHGQRFGRGLLFTLLIAILQGTNGIVGNLIAAIIQTAALRYTVHLCILMVLLTLITPVIAKVLERSQDTSNLASAPPANNVHAPEEIDSNGIPCAIKRANWSAFLWPFPWAASNALPLWLVIAAFFFSPFVALYLLVKGNERAWRSGRWATVEAFNATQRSWHRMTLICIALAVGTWLASCAGSLAILWRIIN